jgi:hypothetical protein
VRHRASSTPSGRRAAARQRALARLRALGELDGVVPVEALQAAVNSHTPDSLQLHSRVADVPDAALAHLESEAIGRPVRTAKAATDSQVMERRTRLPERAAVWGDSQRRGRTAASKGNRRVSRTIPEDTGLHDRLRARSSGVKPAHIGSCGAIFPRE